jgi:hypothetical protein
MSIRTSGKKVSNSIINESDAHRINADAAQTCDDVTLELVKIYLAGRADANGSVNKPQDLDIQGLSNLAHLEGYYLAHLYKSTKNWLEMLNKK